MENVIRIFALTVVFAGAAAAAVSSSTPNAVSSSQSATSKLPIPVCKPGVPSCFAVTPAR